MNPQKYGAAAGSAAFLFINLYKAAVPEIFAGHHFS